MWGAALKFLLHAAVVYIQDLACQESADHRPDPVGDEREPNLSFAESVPALEERGHGRDAHLPDGVVDGQEDDDRCRVFGDEDPEGAQDVDVFGRC